MSKKKHRKRLHFSNFRPNSQSEAVEVPTVAVGSQSPSKAPSAESARSTSKVEGKDSQLPVTDLAPEVRPGFVKLFGPLDTKKNEYPFLWWITEREAHQYLRQREVLQLHFTKRHIRSVHLVEKAAPAASPDPASAAANKPASLRHQSMGDSHDHDTEQNPAGVWTIDDLPRSKSKSKFVQKVFLAVQFSCLQRAA